MKGYWMKIYQELAPWYYLLTKQEEYVTESAIYVEAMRAHIKRPLETLLELGSGGGNNAFHYKHQVKATLTDLSGQMLAISRRQNPDLEHLQGDMRTLRLGRSFDAVFCHDAVCYMTTKEALSQVMQTAFEHLSPNGLALFAPDYTRETFKESTHDGGHNGEDGRALRYLEWVYDPDPSDNCYKVDYALMLREGSSLRIEHDRHTEGLFSNQEWLSLLSAAGFEATMIEKTFEEDGETFDFRLFVGVKNGG
jgi:SAM-dependent methyltransferase